MQLLRHLLFVTGGLPSIMSIEWAHKIRAYVVTKGIFRLRGIVLGLGESEWIPLKSL